MSKCWYCNNELTTCDSPKHFGICNKCYDEMFKSRDTIIRSFTNKIADLETKLAESEKKASKKNDESWDLYLSLKQFYSRLGVEAYADDEIQDVAVKELNRLLNENEQLKQQLSEKENELKKFKNLRATPKQLQRAYQERYKYKERCNELKNQHIKDKISFAVEQLEKVKAELVKLGQDYSLNWCGIKIYNFIDNQINELKEMK